MSEEQFQEQVLHQKKQARENHTANVICSIDKSNSVSKLKADTLAEEKMNIELVAEQHRIDELMQAQRRAEQGAHFKEIWEMQKDIASKNAKAHEIGILKC